MTAQPTPTVMVAVDPPRPWSDGRGMTTYRITCATRGMDAYGFNAPSFVRWTAAKIAHEIDQKKAAFVVAGPDGKDVEVVAFGPEGKRSVRTKADETELNNLDWLPECNVNDTK